MCVISMVADHWIGKTFPDTQPTPSNIDYWIGSISRQEFDALKKDVEDLKSLLKKAKLYDEEHDQPDCETEEKMEILRKVAEGLGLDLEI